MTEPELCPLRAGDAELFRALAGEEEVVRFLPDMRMTESYAAHLAEVSRMSAEFSPTEQQRLCGIYVGETLIGGLTLGPVYETGYRVTVGFFLGKAYRGRGWGRAAVKKALALARDAGAGEVAALAETANVKSLALLEAVGFQKKETLALRLCGEREKRSFILMIMTLQGENACRN